MCDVEMHVMAIERHVGKECQRCRTEDDETLSTPATPAGPGYGESQTNRKQEEQSHEDNRRRQTVEEISASAHRSVNTRVVRKSA